MDLSTFIVPSCFLLGAVGLAIWQRGATLVQHGVQLAQRELDDSVDRAERPLDGIPRWARVGALGGIVFLTRSNVRWLRGDLVASEHLATRAIRADRVAVRTLHSDVTANALAVRALARAAAQRFEEANADLGAVDADRSASLHARARAALARALVLAHDSDVPGLREHLRRTRNAIIQVVHPREIMLLRALERHGRGLPQPYRSTPGASEATAHAWLNTVVPSLIDPNAATEPTERKARTSSPSPLPPPPGVGSTLVKLVALWVLLIVLFLSIWAFVAPDAPQQSVTAHEMEHEVAVESDASSWRPTQLLPLALVLLFLSFVYYQLRTGFRGRTLLAQAQWDACTGRTEAARSALQALSANPQPVVAAQAHAHLVSIALDEGDIDTATDHCGKALRSLNGATIGKSAWLDAVQPSMLMDEAVLRALKGEPEAARKELAALVERHPSASVLREAKFRVELVIAVRAEDWTGALDLALNRPADLGLPLRDEILALMVIAVHGAANLTEVALIRDELEKTPNLCKYVGATAESLLGALTALAPGR